MFVATNKGELLAAMEAGFRPSVRFFPDCGGARHEHLDDACLSQWWAVDFSLDGHLFHSAEQAMMYGKAHLFGDAASEALILAARTQYQAMELGRKVAGFSENLWERERCEVVYRANLPKFAQNPDLCAYLLATGDDVLAEASPVDFVWGIGHAAGDPFAANPQRWPGLNFLGFALMRIREELRTSQG